MPLWKPKDEIKIQYFDRDKTLNLTINADMSSEEKIAASGYGIAGAVPFQLTLPVGRSAYARYEITVE